MPMKSEAKSETIAAEKNASASFSILPAAECAKVLAQTRALVPETFNSEGRILNLIGRNWQEPG
jgi:hypothetical protein